MKRSDVQTPTTLNRELTKNLILAAAKNGQICEILALLEEIDPGDNTPNERVVILKEVKKLLEKDPEEQERAKEEPFPVAWDVLTNAEHAAWEWEQFQLGVAIVKKWLGDQRPIDQADGWRVRRVAADMGVPSTSQEAASKNDVWWLGLGALVCDHPMNRDEFRKSASRSFAEARDPWVALNLKEKAAREAANRKEAF